MKTVENLVINFAKWLFNLNKQKNEGRQKI